MPASLSALGPLPLILLIIIIPAGSSFVIIDEDLADYMSDVESRTDSIQHEQQPQSEIEDFNWPTEAISEIKENETISDLFETYEKIFNDFTNDNFSAVDNFTLNKFDTTTTYSDPVNDVTEEDQTTTTEINLVEENDGNNLNKSKLENDIGGGNTTILIESDNNENITSTAMDSVDKIPDEDVRNEFTKDVEVVSHISFDSVDPFKDKVESSPLDDLSGFVVEDPVAENMSSIVYEAGYDEKIKDKDDETESRHDNSEISYVKSHVETLTRAPDFSPPPPILSLDISDEYIETSTTQNDNNMITFGSTILPPPTHESTTIITISTSTDAYLDNDYERRQEEQLYEVEIAQDVLNETFYDRNDEVLFKNDTIDDDSNSQENDLVTSKDESSLSSSSSSSSSSSRSSNEQV